MRPVLLLLPGMMCDERLFEPQIAHFAGRFEMVVGGLANSDTIEAMAGSVLEQLQGRRAHVLGLSMGGIVALELARQAPSQVKSLALLNTNSGPDAPWRRPVRDAQIAEASTGQLIPLFERTFLPAYLASSTGKREDIARVVMAMAEDLGADVFVRQSVALRDRQGYEDLLPRLECPVLALAGSSDTICPPALHRHLASRVRHGRYAEIEACGHLSTLEQPEAVAKVLDDFFQDIGAGL